MQTHPGFFFYPSLYESGQILFPYIDPECDRSSSHLSRYITAGYFLIVSLAQELTRVRSELAAARSAFAPPLLIHTSLVPPSTPVIPTPSQSSSGTSVVTPHESPAQWSMLLATPATPMLRSHPAPDPEGEPSRQRRRVSFAPDVSVISSDSESDTEETLAGSSVCQCDPGRRM